MKIVRNVFVAVIATVFLLSSCVNNKKVNTENGNSKRPIYLKGIPSITKLKEMQEKKDRFYLQFLGHFSNRPFVQEHPEYQIPPQDAVVIQILKGRTGEFWTYTEIFIPGQVKSPVVQRIERIKRVNRDTFLMDAFVLKEPQKYINEWSKDNPFPTLSIEDLVPAEGCSLHIVNTREPHVYKTIPLTDEITCYMPPVNIAGSIVKYVHLELTYSAGKIDTERDLYNEKKELVIKYPEGGVPLYRQDETTSGYVDLTSLSKSKKK